MKKKKKNVQPLVKRHNTYVASRASVISIRPMGSHSLRYLATGVSLSLSLSFLFFNHSWVPPACTAPEFHHTLIQCTHQHKHLNYIESWQSKPNLFFSTLNPSTMGIDPRTCSLGFYYGLKQNNKQPRAPNLKEDWVSVYKDSMLRCFKEFYNNLEYFSSNFPLKVCASFSRVWVCPI